MNQFASGTRLRLGTRASALAQWQARWVATALAQHGAQVELVLLSSEGDQHQQQPIGALNTQGVFTKTLQQALLAGQIDLAVHSLKDLPTETVAGLRLAAVPPREEVADVLVSTVADSLEQLPEGASVGTGSPRRQAQLLAYRADLVVQAIRGNLDTRLRKLREGQVQALVLAKAGLTRLGWQSEIRQEFSAEVMLPAVGQGALGIECRSDDTGVCQQLAQLDHLPTHCAVRAERALLAELRGGCLAPVAAWARPDSPDSLRLSARVLSIDGSQRLDADLIGEMHQPEDLGKRVAAALLEMGAARLIADSRQ